ncbi:hypothetical protein BC834DRAFT_1045882 [Gloeopeniophorella convolvens]|nr:hypothetical protein BC834DRAFT_1045882 [Gloeopeniophorella convolvens]
MRTTLTATLIRRLISLPAELWVKIIGYGDWRLIVACSQTCGKLNMVIRGSAALRYELELAASGMQCGEDSHIDAVTHLQRLQEHQKAWETLSWSESSAPEVLNTINLPPIASGGLLARIKYNFIDGNHLVSVALAVHRLPSKLRGVEEKHWDFILGFHSWQFDVDEVQDLAVIQPNAGVNFHVLQLSTGDPHHLSETHGLIEYPPRAFYLDTLIICGDRFAALAQSYEEPRTKSILIWNWKTGERFADIPYPAQPSLDNLRSYEFLDEDHIVAAGLDKDYLTASLLIYEIRAGPEPVAITDGRCFRVALPPLPAEFAHREVVMRRNVIKPRRAPGPHEGLREAGAERMLALQLTTTTCDVVERDIHVPARILLKLFHEHPPATVLPPSKWAAWAVRIMEDSPERLVVHRSMGMRVLTGPPVLRESDGRWVVRVRDYSPARIARAEAATMPSYPAYYPEDRKRKEEKERQRKQQKEMEDDGGLPFLEQEIALPEEVRPNDAVTCSLLENGIATFEVRTDLQHRGKITKMYWYSF